MEGRLGALSVTGARQTSQTYIKAGVQTATGEVVDVPALNRSVALFNRTNEIQLRAQLRAGGQFGLTDIELAATEPARNIVQIFGDNQAGSSSGRYQAGLYWRHHGLFGIDDRFTFYGSATEGSLYGSGSFNIPVTPFGTRVGVSYSRNRYRVTDGPLVDLNSRGESQNGALNLSQPLFASGPFFLLASGSLTLGDSKSDQAGAPVVRSSFRRVTGGLALTWATDRFSLSASPNVSQVHWKNAIEGATRDFVVFGGTTTNTVKFTDQIYAQLVGSWQYSREQLLPGDQRFQIGGPTSVRGFPIGVASGDSGYYGQGELHYAFGQGWTNIDAFVFLDHGAVYTTFPKVTRATSAGAGVVWRPADWVTLETSVGFPLKNTTTTQRHHEVYVRLSFKPSLN